MRALLAIRVFTAILLLLLSTTLPAAENPAVPGQVQYAGRIFATEDTEDTEDTEGTEGIRGVTFSLFAEQSGGAALWVENQNVSVSAEGAYNTLLGAETQGGIPQSIFASGEARWLEVSYTGADGVQVTQPRVLLVSVPYAMKAGDAATLGGLPVSAFVLNTDAVASRVSDNGGLPGATVTDVLPTAAVTAGRIAKFNSALATDVVDSIITELSGKIGIGTTTPVGTIDVGGWANIPNDIVGVGSTISGDVFMGNTGLATGRFRMASNSNQGFFSWNQYFNGTNHKGMDATAPGWRVNIGGKNNEDAYYVERSPATAGGHIPVRLFVVSGNGRVGINTDATAPVSTLDVGGWPDMPLDIQGVGSNISGDAFMGNVGGNSGRYRMASNANQGFFSWNQYYNGTVHRGMDATAPGWRINVGGKGVEDAFYVERSPATAGTHAPARLFQVSGNGNVGIGTIAPTALLDVAGTVKMTGFTLETVGKALGKVLTSDAAGNGAWQSLPSGAISGSGTLNRLPKFTPDGTTLGDSLILDDGTNVGIGTLSPASKLHVVGNIQASGNLVLPSTSDANSGVVLAGTARFLHYYGTANTFLGSGSGNFTLTTANTNTGVGNGAMASLTNGNFSAALGANALGQTTTGSSNTAVGSNALAANTTGGNNTAVGVAALQSSSAASENTAIGSAALFSNSTGTHNTAVGRQALLANTSTSENTALGYNSLAANTGGSNNTAVGSTALDANTNGSQNTAVGFSALGANTFTNNNSALGFNALGSNTAGAANTAVGSAALAANTDASNNTAVGFSALAANTIGTRNTAMGQSALTASTIGNSNSAFGAQAMQFNTDGQQNTAVGTFALELNTSGQNNVALGIAALRNNTTGSFNIAIGSGAGDIATTGNSNIYIGNFGQVAEANTTRIGADQTRTFIDAIRGVTTGNADAIAVMIDSSGQLGTVSSSRRFKQDINDMASASARLMQLRPVSFRYKKPYADGSQPIQYGLIAEEVAETFPELAAYSADGQIETVRYHILPSLLLNEAQHQQREIESLKAQLAARDSQVSVLSTKADTQGAEIGELREMLISLQRQLGTQVSKAVSGQ